MHLVLARDILPNNTSAIRPILAPSVQQLGRGRAPSSPITDGTDYLSTVRPELGRDYQNPVRTGLCGTLVCRRYRSRWLVHRTMRRRYQSHLRECTRSPSGPHLMTLPLLLRNVEDRAASKQVSNKEQQDSKVNLIKQVPAGLIKTSAVEKTSWEKDQLLEDKRVPAQRY